MKARVLLASLLLAPHATAAQTDALLGDAFEYAVYLGEEEVGREQVRLAPDGWSAEGRYDFLGVRKGSYRASLRHGEAGLLEYEFTSDESGEARSLSGVFAEGKWSVSSDEREKSVPVAGPDVFTYDDLLWVSLADLGRLLVARESRSELVAGAQVTALSGVGGLGFPVEFVDSARSTQVVGGKDLVLGFFRVKLAGKVEVTLVTTPEGVPIRIEVPAQLVRVQATGFESVHGPVTEPTSPVDAGPWRAQLSQPTHAFTVERAVEIPMRDGVKLVADVLRPTGEGKFPIVLARTPYNRLSEGALHGGWYAKRGYAFVAQDVRGRFASGGEWFPFVHESRDGSDTLDWIAQHGWSDGKVGMIGGSYVGLVQWLAAKSGNPHLVCIVPQVSPPDPHENFPYEGGAFMLAAGWWARVLEALDTGASWSAGLDFEQAYATLPLGDLDQALQLKEQEFDGQPQEGPRFSAARA